MIFNKHFEKKPIQGIVVTAFSDMGPKVFYNSVAALSESQAMTFGIALMTMLGEYENIDESLFGPVPVQGHDELLCFTFPLHVKNEYQTDPRLKRLVVNISVIYKHDFKRMMSHAFGLVQSFLRGFAQKEFHYESDLRDDKFIRISTILSSMITTNPIRIYRIDNLRITEHIGTMGLTADAYIIGDINQKILYIVFDPKVSILKKRSITTVIDKFNKDRFQFGFNKRIVEDFDEISRLKSRYGFAFLDYSRILDR